MHKIMHSVGPLQKESAVLIESSCLTQTVAYMERNMIC